jgi:hypothetical protein
MLAYCDACFVARKVTGMALGWISLIRRSLFLARLCAGGCTPAPQRFVARLLDGEAMTEVRREFDTSRRTKTESVTRVSGTKCHLCLRSLIEITMLF